MKRTDRVTLEILKSYFVAIAEAMAHTLVRTAHTTFVKESADFSTGIATLDGEFFSYPRNLGVSTFLGLNLGAAIRSQRRYAPGDVVITNDPYATDGLVTHLPDIHMFKPVFFDGQLLCFAWCFIHCSDVGGLVPASISPRASEVQQEGLRLTPKKLFKRGRLNKDLLSVFLDNCRIPEQNWGDLKAMIAALNTAERRVGEMCAKFGSAVVAQGMVDLLDWTEEGVRAVFETIPDGEYCFHDYLDDAMDGIPVRLALRLKVHGSDIELDYSGTDPQVHAAMNLPAFGPRHPFLAQGLINFAFTENPGIPLTGAVMRPIRAVTPRGSIVNPRFPAAIGVRYATVIRLYNVVLGALAQAVPTRVPAAGCGQGCMVVLSAPDLDTGERRVAVLEPFMGGGAATARTDGALGIDTANGSLKNTPVESIEAEMPVVIQRYESRIDSAGAGRQRGGSGMTLEFRVSRPHSIVTARGMERCRFEPWGRAGGHAAGRTRAFVNVGTPSERELEKIDVLSLAPGDTVTMWATGGGGYGNPLERAPELVGADVRNGFVSRVDADRLYGVICDESGTGDIGATSRRRTELAAGRPQVNESFIDVGPSRRAYESIWTSEASEMLAALMLALPHALRTHAKRLVHERVDAREKQIPLTSESVSSIWSELRLSPKPAKPVTSPLPT